MYAKDNHATSGSHASVPPGSLIGNRYEVIRQAGTGNFARVFECTDRRTSERVAVKLLKRGYERDADFECEILRAINKHDTAGTANTVKLLDRSVWNGLAMIVFNLKGAPLRNTTLPMSARDVAVAAKDVADALAFLHFSVRAVHTDLKPENILAETSSSSGRKWSICDLGSASFYSSKLDTDLITTRPYRAPEVLLNKGWSYPADTWSLGCILYELRTARKLFDCHTDADQLALMEQRLGPLPNGRRYATSTSRRAALLRDELRNEDSDFTDLLLRMLSFDTSARIRCSEIANHPFVTKATGTSRSASRSASANSDAATLTASLGDMALRPTLTAASAVTTPRTTSTEYRPSAAPAARALGEIPRAAANSRPSYALKQSIQKPLLSPMLGGPSVGATLSRPAYAF